MTTQNLINEHINNLPNLQPVDTAFATRATDLYTKSKLWYEDKFGWTSAGEYDDFIERISEKLGL